MKLVYKNKPKRKFGQYFLKDKNIAKKIVNNLSFKNYSTVVEVGPGLGILTKYLIEIMNKKKLINNLILIEIDKDLISFLRKFIIISNNKIIHKDFLKWNPKKMLLHNFAIIGNFPYNISSRIMFHIIKYSEHIPECVGMIQKEVAERIISNKGKKNGILSILIQMFFDVKYLFTVKNTVFYPTSKVDSAVIYLKRKKNKITDIKKNFLFQCVKKAFSQRRKKIKNSLYLFDNNKSSIYKIPFLNKRAEELSVKDFIQLAKSIEKIKNND
ncbi:16S rRNA (adenine(1518)-N(6)/adenine(1519)-N(6))-dimethyltransferase RsmA [Blattabacterium cuenoti]|uniref:16S rRNA (adenine(1518)-N(6)/adenine(1519)-N(6))- dimethyltransferase RsmA n=1 Tax=Blattabacterium cuenoti TaxID=1653831 RepID=UPI00163C292A|nr:16S rRNA (adenine(1518)-N(6)/adenine(1519)-N(6))-dimethyltransferase RsmA [Blattabacterium cuenoti]